jgi:putative oxidoreductase
MQIRSYFLGSHPAAYNSSVSFCLLMLRWILGAIMFVAGAGKLFGWFGGFGMDMTLKFMREGNFTEFLTWANVLCEFIGGGLLLLGLFTRFAGMVIFINMVVAVWTTGLQKFFMGGAAYTFTLAVIALVIAILGAGRYSLDYLIDRKRD